MKRIGDGATNLSQLRRQMAWWRARQAKRGPLPEPLWESAVGLARLHGVSRVARELRLDYYKLKQRLVVAEAVPSASAASRAFVEVAVARSPSPTPEYTLELADRHGAKLTMRWRGDAGVLVSLAQAFWQQGR